MRRTELSRRSFLFGTQTDRSLSEDEAGATAIEYGLIAGLLAVSVITILRRTGRRTARPFRCSAAAMRRARRGLDTPNCAKLLALAGATVKA